MNKKINPFLSIALIVLFAILLSEIIYFCGVKIITVSNKNIGIQEQASFENTSDWETYSNSEYNFSFQYPSKLGNTKTQIGTTDAINHYGKKGFYHVVIRPLSWQDYFFMVSVSDKSMDRLINDYISSISWAEEINKVSDEIDGNQSMKVNYKMKNGNITYSEIFIKKDNKVFTLSGGAVEGKWASNKIANPSKETWEKIASSFKFDETADWKTYKNNKYGYELKYPKNWHIDTKEADREIYCGGPNNEDCYGGLLSISNYQNLEQYKPQSLDDKNVLKKPADLIELGLNISITDESFLINNLCENSPSHKILNKEKTIINGNAAINCSSVTIDHPVGVYVDSTTIKKGDKVFKFGHVKNEQSDRNEVVEKIISTFKILN